MAYQKAPMLTVYSLTSSKHVDDTTSQYVNYITYYAQMNFCGFVELYSSLLWDIEYFTVGSFEIYLPATQDYLKLFQIGRIVAREDDTENYGVIESVLVEHDAEEGDYMTVSGRFLPCLLERRVILPTAYASSDILKDTDFNPALRVGTIVRGYGNFTKYVLTGSLAHSWIRAGTCDYGTIPCGYIDSDGAFVELTESENTRAGRRMIPGLAINSKCDGIWNRALDTIQVTGKNLMEWVYTICEEIGGTIRIDASNLINNLGEDSYMILTLSSANNLSGVVTFSDDYNNLSAVSYSENYANCSTFAYALGSGEGNERQQGFSHEASDAPVGFERREIYVDASSTSEVGNDTEASSDEVKAGLRQEGLEALSSPTYAAEATIAPDVQYTYGEDYSVGDIVTIEYSALGISLDARLTGMIESFDHTGRTLTPTFSFDV